MLNKKRRGASGDMGTILMTFLLMVIALALTPTVQEQVTGVTGVGGNNLTGADFKTAKSFWKRIQSNRGFNSLILGNRNNRDRGWRDLLLLKGLNPDFGLFL